MKIEVGKYYRTCGGLKVGPMYRVLRGSDAFFMQEDEEKGDLWGRLWLPDGASPPDLSGYYDLVAEWSDEPQFINVTVRNLDAGFEIRQSPAKVVDDKTDDCNITRGPDGSSYDDTETWPEVKAPATPVGMTLHQHYVGQALIALAPHWREYGEDKDEAYLRMAKECVYMATAVMEALEGE